MVNDDSKQEKDYLEYTGNNVPKFLRFFWTVFIVFMFVYLIRYMYPDLIDWMNK